LIVVETEKNPNKVFIPNNPLKTIQDVKQNG